jgi:predicted Zn-dependent peptidase
MNKYKLKVLSNKASLYVVPLKEAKTITLLFIFKTGSKYESQETNGLSHFLEHMFFKGTKKRPNTVTISSDLDSLGGEYNAFTSKEYTGYFVKIAAAKFKSAINILSDMLLHSLFDKEEIEREKGVIIEELNMYEDNPLMHIEDVFESCLYGDTPAGWDTIGTKKNIRNFKRQDFIDYLTTQYGSKSLSLVLAGNIKKTDQLLAEKLLGEFSNNKWQNKIKVVENQKKPSIKVAHKKTDQLTLSLGVRTVPAGHPQEFKLKMLSTILGGAMSSRLFIRLRERNGLAYFVRTTTEFHSDCGYLTTTAGVPPIRAKEAIAIILEEYQLLTKELVSDIELKRAKDIILGRISLKMEATDDVASWYGQQAVLTGKIITPEQFLRAIKNIRAVDLRQTARQIFIESNLNLALIGKVNPDSFKEVLKFKK